MNDYNELIEAYKEIYYANEGDFNVLNAIHLGENDHTNILCGILNLKVDNGKPFMTSFVKEVLGITYIDNYDSLMALTQISAIGSKEDSHGYIDLLIKDKDNKVFIVIENKVCDATDMPHQLDRYYFTFVQNNELLKKYYDIEFQAKCISYWESSLNQKQPPKVYIVYLTKDGTKEPSEESINNKLKDELKNKGQYKGISYRDNISNWLNDVGASNNNSIELYRLALNKFLTTKEAKNKEYLKDKAILSFINEKVFKGKYLSLVDQYINLKKTYDMLNDLKKKLDEDSESDLVLNDLVDCVECYRDNVYGQYALEGWTIHRAPNYIVFYPNGWLEKFGGNVNSNIHFGVNWEKGEPKFDFGVQNKAGETYSKRLRENEKNFYDVVNDIQEDGNWKHHKGTDLSIKFDVQNMNLAWDIDNVDTTKEFFNNFAKNQSIINLINWIDNNLK